MLQVCSYAFVTFFLFFGLYFHVYQMLLPNEIFYLHLGQYASNMLSWHVASEANSAANGDPLAAPWQASESSSPVNPC